MKYFFIVAMISLFVLFYVWQNIEVMKMKMEYRRLANIERSLSEENKRLLFDIERMRNFKKVESSLSGSGVKRITPEDVLVVKSKESKKNDTNEIK